MRFEAGGPPRPEAVDGRLLLLVVVVLLLVVLVLVEVATWR